MFLVPQVVLANAECIVGDAPDWYPRLNLGRIRLDYQGEGAQIYRDSTQGIDRTDTHKSYGSGDDTPRTFVSFQFCNREGWKLFGIANNIITGNFLPHKGEFRVRKGEGLLEIVTLKGSLFRLNLNMGKLGRLGMNLVNFDESEVPGLDRDINTGILNWLKATYANEIPLGESVTFLVSAYNTIADSDTNMGNDAVSFGATTALRISKLDIVAHYKERKKEVHFKVDGSYRGPSAYLTELFGNQPLTTVDNSTSVQEAGIDIVYNHRDYVSFFANYKEFAASGYRQSVTPGRLFSSSSGNVEGKVITAGINVGFPNK